MQRAAITGIGIISSLGLTPATVTASLRSGTSGIKIDSERRERGFRCVVAGAIEGFDASVRFDRKTRRTMGEAAAYGCAAALDAVADAGLKDLARPEVGIIFGNDSTCESNNVIFDSLAKEKRTSALGSGHIIKIMNSTVTMNLATMLGVKGACWTLSAACASGLHAIGQAAMLIATGQQDIVLCGGAQESSWQGMAAFDALGALSSNSENPTTASRPFDRTRDGLVPSGGGACVIVESLEHARARGAKIYAEISGYAFGCDGSHLTNPNGEGAVRVMRQALKNSNVHPGEVEFVHAHATSTPVGDAVEAKALREVFADRKVPVVSTKGLTGHECWMSGASEVIYSLLMMQEGFIAGNAHLQQPDPDSALLELPRQTLALKPRTILKNSFGFGGTNAAVVLRGI
jgi:3-oxoacyl-[acyl-carrier-protein] synthase-1